jgi:ubiquitin C-terminal hydrolase
MTSSDTKGVVGLTNVGNTCYGNSVIQALRHQVDLTIFILQGHFKNSIQNKASSEKTRLLESYGDLIRSLWSSESGEVNTKPFWSTMIPAAIKEGFAQFRVPIPHDAHEFLCFLLDQFHEALAEEVSMTIRSSTSDTDIKSALEFWKTSFEKKYSPLVELLFGIQRKSVKCENCKHESISWETMNITKVCVPKSDRADLLQLMKEEGGGEEIEEYSCDTCKVKKVKATINRSLWRLGNWVIIVLKRNENNGRRINTHVDIPLTTCFGSVFHPSSRESSASDSYDLFATIHHHGSAGGGHYTAHAKHPVSGRWAHYDDESAVLVDNPLLNASTYIVMYRRKNS